MDAIRLWVVPEGTAQKLEQLPLFHRKHSDHVGREAAWKVPLRTHPLPSEEGVDGTPLAVVQLRLPACQSPPA